MPSQPRAATQQRALNSVCPFNKRVLRLIPCVDFPCVVAKTRSAYTRTHAHKWVGLGDKPEPFYALAERMALPQTALLALQGPDPLLDLGFRQVNISPWFPRSRTHVHRDFFACSMHTATLVRMAAMQNAWKRRCPNITCVSTRTCAHTHARTQPHYANQSSHTHCRTADRCRIQYSTRTSIHSFSAIVRPRHARLFSRDGLVWSGLVYACDDDGNRCD